MKKKKIWIFQSGEPLFLDKKKFTPMRAMQLCNLALKKNFEIKLISSNFNHLTKKKRYKGNFQYKIVKVNNQLEQILINSSGYRNNVSLRRLIDHFYLAKNLKKFLKNTNNLPDVGFVGFPPIETTVVFSNWLFKKKIPFFVDIKDLWPEYFYARFAKNLYLSFFVKCFFFIYDYFLKKALKKASAISSNNNFFLGYILNKINRKKNKFDTICFLTKDLKKDIKTYIPKKNLIDKKKFNIYFGGNINFFQGDFLCFLDSIKILQNQKIIFNVYFAGYGVDVNTLKKKISELKLQSVFFLGYVSSKQHLFILKNCNLVFNGTKNTLNYSNNLSNKVIECLQLNTPLIHCLKGNLKNIINKYDIGTYYIEGDSEDLSKKLKKFISNKKFYYDKKKNFKKNSLSELYDHETNYNKLLNNIVRISIK